MSAAIRELENDKTVLETNTKDETDVNPKAADTKPVEAADKEEVNPDAADKVKQTDEATKDAQVKSKADAAEAPALKADKPVVALRKADSEAVKDTVAAAPTMDIAAQ